MHSKSVYISEAPVTKKYTTIVQLLFLGFLRALLKLDPLKKLCLLNLFKQTCFIIAGNSGYKDLCCSWYVKKMLCTRLFGTAVQLKVVCYFVSVYIFTIHDNHQNQIKTKLHS